VRLILLVLFAIHAAGAQTGTASIQGTVLDAKTQKPVPAAWVMANRAGAPPFTRSTKSGADGAFQIPGLTAGSYTLCVQVAEGRYLDPCQWSASPITLTLTAGQAASGTSLRLTPASLLTVQLQDPLKAMNQKTKDGRRPDVSVGVWGPKGLYYPARDMNPTAAAGSSGGAVTYTYQLAIPRDTTLNFHIASNDLKLGDGAGAVIRCGAQPPLP
jgi:hypothetical protein